MKYAVHITERALYDLGRMDKNIARRIVDKLTFFESTGEPLCYAKKLNDSIYGTYRFRIGEYRAIFDIDAKGEICILMILRVKHRKDVYR
ncbi:MAG: type II toxin-antitoxin system RelE/ParE family toxin [Candidatus Uhrbacteria bacterium]|nr:type II toxin-antitoxin system RelE/ParE family toxin [Candidatus Uhrbacteria bacterium]